MSIWNLYAVKGENTPTEPAPPISVLDKADLDAVRPFAAECICGIQTYLGIKKGFKKPVLLEKLVWKDFVSSRDYALLLDSMEQAMEQALALIVRGRNILKILEERIELEEMTDRFFYSTFSENGWSDIPVSSHVRRVGGLVETFVQVGVGK